ncbi:DUF2178 domain-containing protein [Halobacteriales archaeon SW_7_68_16]|nr:MAG: DUF2178 domain-containing protein [Halobacteriales archaeon SW_7_68_16]
MNESDSDTSIAQLASGPLFGLAALVLAVFAQSRPFVAVGGYAILTGTAGLALYVAGGDFGQSDDGIQKRAAGDVTLALIGMASAVVFPGLVLAAGLGYFTWTPLAAGIAFAVAGLYAVYGVVALSQRARARPA